MQSLKNEYERLSEDEKACAKEEFISYIEIKNTKNSKQRTISFNMKNIEKYRDQYAGHICFITNDKLISTAESALSEYSTKNYIEKDFDEIKNDSDMKQIGVHTVGRINARLLIQFIAEIILREIRIKLHNSNECKNLTKKQIVSHIEGIHKIVFKGKSKDIKPELTKIQRAILDALGLTDER